MHILHILDHSIPLHSGYTFRTRNILLQQRARGWQTSHITGLKQGFASEPKETVDELTFYRTPAAEGVLDRLPVINQWRVINTLAKRLKQVVDEIKPDILHAHSPALNGLAALKVARQTGIPLVYECRAFWEDAAVDHGTSSEGGLRYKLTRALESRVFAKADAVTTICEGLRKDIVARGISPDKVTVIPNAVDIENFAMDQPVNLDLQEKLGLKDKQVLGFIGSFYAYEGLPLILDAMPALAKQFPDIKLLLVGGGPQEDLIKQKTATLQLQDRVILTGRVPHSEVQDYYNLVDIFVYPRLSMRLTDLVTPLKPLEAMAQGRLVVASDVGGHQELIENGKTGRLFKAGDAKDLAAVVAKLLDDEERWPAMRAAGRDYVENVRNWPNSVANYQAIYDKLLAGKRA
ncbi:MAG: glycosyltransferase, exosortase A system-associated [Gammaproteobacteria bacterium]|nr:MAG: glycosyltransferase, exosortase A system-associated [Gammaproteobacteria bacterium]